MVTQNRTYCTLFSPVNEDINKAVVEVTPSKLDFSMLLDHAELGSELWKTNVDKSLPIVFQKSILRFIKDFAFISQKLKQEQLFALFLLNSLTTQYYSSNNLVSYPRLLEEWR